MKSGKGHGMKKVAIPNIIVLAVLLLTLCGCQPQDVDVPDAESSPMNTPSPSATPAQPPSESTIPSIQPTEQQPAEPTKPPTATLEEGWSMYTDEDEGFEIALPDMWSTLTKEQIEKTGINPGEGFKCIFYAVDIFSTSLAIAQGKPQVLEFVSSLSIVKKSTGTQKTSLAEIEEYNLHDLTAHPNVSQPIYHERIEFLCGEVLKFKHTKKLPNRTEPVVFVQYILIESNNVYCFTCETLPYLIEEFEPTYDKMVNSFRLTH